MGKSLSKMETTTDKLRKLSKDDLIWCILEMEKHTLGFPSIDRILSELKYKKDMDNIDRCEKLAKKASEKRAEYLALLAPYDGKLISDIPKPILDRGLKLLEEAQAADKEWFRLSGIKEKR